MPYVIGSECIDTTEHVLRGGVPGRPARPANPAGSAKVGRIGVDIELVNGED